MVFTEGPQIADCVNQNNKLPFLEADSTKGRKQKSTEPFLGWVSRRCSLGGPLGRSSGSCPVAMALITHTGRAKHAERNGTVHVIVVFVAAVSVA